MTIRSLVQIGLVVLFVSTLGEAHEGGESPKPQVGGGRAVSAFDEEHGFQLTEKALQSLKIQFRPITGAQPWSIPKQALVKVKHANGVYRRFEGWITLVLVKVIKTSDNEVMISSEDLQSGDEIAVGGTNFLRVIELDLSAGEADGRGH